MKRFNDLLLNFAQCNDGAERDRIETVLWEEYGSERTVFVLDMSGFSLLTQRYGVIHYLSMVRRMQLTVTPIVESHKGEVVKFKADNCYAVFPESRSAVRAAIAMNLAFEAANIVTPDELDIRISCGIDKGEILMIEHQDLFGNAVNRASKLGEDIAGPGEILITKEASETIPQEAGVRLSPLELSISGIELSAFAVEY